MPFKSHFVSGFGKMRKANFAFQNETIRAGFVKLSSHVVIQPIDLLGHEKLNARLTEISRKRSIPISSRPHVPSVSFKSTKIIF